MRKYINGKGWRFELIDNVLYFHSNHKSWNHNINDLVFVKNNTSEVVYIRFSNIKCDGQTYNKDSTDLARFFKPYYFFRMFFLPLYLQKLHYEDEWYISYEDFRNIKVFLNEIKEIKEEYYIFDENQINN